MYVFTFFKIHILGAYRLHRENLATLCLLYETKRLLQLREADSRMHGFAMDFQALATCMNPGKRRRAVASSRLRVVDIAKHWRLGPIEVFLLSGNSPGYCQAIGLASSCFTPSSSSRAVASSRFRVVDIAEHRRRGAEDG